MFENFNRLHNAIIYCGQLVLLEILHGHSFPTDESLLYQHLYMDHRVTLQTLRTNNTISQQQWRILFPNNKRTNSKEFDISLCIILVRNCTNVPGPVNSWKKPPLVCDNSIAANVIRLNYFRNKYEHSSWLLFMTDKTFAIEWKEMEDILTDLGYQQLPHKLDLARLKTIALDSNNASFQRFQNLFNVIFVVALMAVIMILLNLRFPGNIFYASNLVKGTAELKKLYISNIGSKVESTIDNKVLSKRFYVQLNVISDKTFRAMFKHFDISHHINQHLKGINSSNIITMDQLLEGEEYKFIIIRGVGGMGKTHLAEELSLRWANDSSFWNNLQFVFFLKCRELNNLNVTSYKEILPLKYPNIFKYLTFDELTTRSSQLLIILDGLDELVYKDNHFQHIKLIELLDPASNDLPNMKVIVTGRPLSISRFVIRFRIYNRKEVDILGFSEESVISFIDYMLFNVTTAKRVKHLVKSNEYFGLMSRIPVYLKLICMIYGSYETIGSIETVTELYVWQLALYIQQYVKRKEIPRVLDEPHEIFELPWVQNIIIEVAELSYEMFVQGLAIIEKESNVKWKMYDKLEDLGFVLKISSSKFQFFHMTMQEFMVAIHLSLNEQLFCEVEINEDSEILFLYTGLQGGLVANSQSAAIIKNFAQVMNFTRNSKACTRKVKHVTWIKLVNEYRNKQDNNPFFWNISSYRAHMHESYFHEMVIEDWKFYSQLFSIHLQGIIDYSKLGEIIDNYCLNKQWRHSCVYTVTYFPCKNGYSITLKENPCIIDKNIIVRKEIHETAPNETKCFTTDNLLHNNKINYKNINFVRYAVPHIAYEFGPASNILSRYLTVIENKELFLIIGCSKHYKAQFNIFFELVKNGIKHRGKYFKNVGYIPIIEHELEVSSGQILHNTTIRISRRDKYANQRNMFVIIRTLCCLNTLSSLSCCSEMSKNLYKRFERNTKNCWEDSREMIYF